MSNNGLNSRADADARFAEWAALIPIILELFPELKVPGLDVNNSSRLDKIEAKIDRLLAAHGISDPVTPPPIGGGAGGGGAGSGSNLANLIREILALLRPGQSSGGQPVRMSLAGESLSDEKRERMIIALRGLLDDVDSTDSENPKVAGDHLEAAVERAEAAVKAANAEVVRAEAAQKIEEIRRERDEKLRDLNIVKKELTLTERIAKQKERLEAVNQKTPADDSPAR
ncbi:MAG: hypothetical protein O3A00_29075 [Planctomycetota bacterium]|nr:hypothetical protein [Planctomycetota bacterium]